MYYTIQLTSTIPSPEGAGHHAAGLVDCKQLARAARATLGRVGKATLSVMLPGSSRSGDWDGISHTRTFTSPKTLSFPTCRRVPSLATCWVSVRSCFSAESNARGKLKRTSHLFGRATGPCMQVIKYSKLTVITWRMLSQCFGMATKGGGSGKGTRQCVLWNHPWASTLSQPRATTSATVALMLARTLLRFGSGRTST